RRRHTRSDRDWSSDVCSSDLCNSTRVLIAVRALMANYATGDDRISGAGEVRWNVSAAFSPTTYWKCSVSDYSTETRNRLECGRRSEERRVGKEWRGRWGAYQW